MHEFFVWFSSRKESKLLVSNQREGNLVFQNGYCNVRVDCNVVSGNVLVATFLRENKLRGRERE